MDTLPSAAAGTPPPEKKIGYSKFSFMCVLLASMNSILLGYDYGVMSGAVLFIKDDFKISDTKVEILLGILSLYALVGSFAAGRTSDWIGRRYTMVFAAVNFFAGAILMGFATGYAFLMFGRFVAGIGAGYGLMIAPVYTAELSPASTRGFLTSFPEIFINTGILLGYVLNYAFAGLPRNLGWRFMLGVGAVPSVALAFAVLVMPESPRWLVMQGRLGEAKRILHKISGTPEEAELRLEEIKMVAGIPEDCNEEVVFVVKRNNHERVWSEMLLRSTPAVRRAVLTAVLIHFFQQASGMSSVGIYSPRMFKKAGIHKETSLLALTIAVGFTKTLFILVATFMLDRAGRRPLLLSSSGGMIVSLLLLATGLREMDKHADEEMVTWAVVLCITSVLSFVAFFSIGMGPVTWVYSSEILPLRVRAQGMSIAIAVNCITSGVLNMTFISLYKAITIGGSFFLFAGMAAAAWLFFFLFVPETRGRSLEDMEALFKPNYMEIKKAQAQSSMNPSESTLEA